MSIEADFYVPQDFTGDTHTIAPDSVVAKTAERYGLLGDDLRVCDPACGAYTIPRVLRRLGASVVDASDINPDHCVVARREAALLTVQHLGTGVVLEADLLALRTEVPYNAVYTSLPFAWFAGDEAPISAYAKALKALLIGNGKLIIDSADTVLRGLKKIAVAEEQIKYFTANGFSLIGREDFSVAAVPGFDTRFTELAFIRT